MPSNTASVNGLEKVANGVTADVAEGSRAKVEPASPRERVQVVVAVAVRGDSDPLIPVHARRHRLGGRASEPLRPDGTE